MADVSSELSLEPKLLRSGHVLRVASDKSLTHRAIMFAAMAPGQSCIDEPLLGADCLSTKSAFEALGVRFDLEPNRLRVDSPGWLGWQQPQVDLDMGNSGTSARLLLGVFAATPGLRVRLIGDASLSKRPMDRVVKPLRAMGAKIEDDGPEAGFLPLTVTGTDLDPCDYRGDKASAQVKSALLLAALRCHGASRVCLPGGSRDHTEKILRIMGANCQSSIRDGFETVTVAGPFLPGARDWRIPADPSSAAFFAVLASIHPCTKLELSDVLINPTRCGFKDVLWKMGVTITASRNSESAEFIDETASLVVNAQMPLKAVTTCAQDLPTFVDEIPILAVAACFAEGRSVFRGLAELRVKESDRLAQTAALLEAAGKSAWIEGDDLIVDGSLAPARCFTFDPDGDHRLAMAASILSTRASGTCRIKGAACVDVSFPGFFKQLEQVCG